MYEHCTFQQSLFQLKELIFVQNELRTSLRLRSGLPRLYGI